MANTAGWAAVLGGAAAIVGTYLSMGWLSYVGGAVALIGGIMLLRK